MNLTHRQSIIFEFIKNNKNVSSGGISDYVSKKIDEVNRVTIIRDLDFLLKNNVIRKVGKGRATKYQEKIDNKLLAFFDVENYFSQNVDKRKDVKKAFNFEVFDYFNIPIISVEEKIRLDVLNVDYKKRVQKLSPTVLKKEFERLTIELSWKSSQIEGNTYSLIDTEILIKENKEAKKYSKEETQMILNHKKALDYIFAHKNTFKTVNLAKIEDVHKMLVDNMGVKINIRNSLVGITGTNYRPLDNAFQIKEAVEKLNKYINKKNVHPLEKALLMIIFISYIQPFEDGNKRTGRLIGNAILIAHGYCPLSYRSVESDEYKKAVLLFYEQNSLRYFKELFMEQFEFSVYNYFGVV
ncbi:MAG: hypothetical protein AUJ23_00435 [Candidatus Magasanikbacteria bacterium CG1_02_32_51]|uniref:Fido domain-containing protein n=1 Tax=Candidatus Magasanikbacteria bacterium CG1_02_32_51 TaxID=1805238 RepID=A0A1J4UDZ8_9BACT|nr:MAG: hypothetical protein AUJ23_00435 [Candidatus Magasanikbacteria bacterium CG1_02_32_51]